MKKFLLSYLIVLLTLISLPVLAQEDTASLGLAGDNLDLYAVLTLFQKSKTIEAFEKSLNEEKGINNLDLNLDKKVDFIKVTTKQKDSSFQFILQVDISKTETQDVAVILVDKQKNKKVSLQIVGDELLYGKDYVVEPKGNSPVTANPGYTGDDPVPVNVTVKPATTTVVVEQAPIVQYVYSPAYVPYVPPYYYGYYPPYFAFGMCLAVGIYRANTWGYHGGYYGGHYGGHNTVIINNNNNFNNYNNNKMRSNTVNNNMQRGNYGDGRGANGNRGSGNRGSASQRPATGDAGRGNRPSTGGPSASTRPSTGADRPNISGGGADRPSTSDRSRPSTSNNMSNNRAGSSSMNQSRTRSSSSGGFGGGGGGRAGGGGGGRRR